jgi:hypothetical protein
VDYTERLELPDGQWAVLLTRLPYNRAHRIRTQASHDSTIVAFADACVRAFLWEASLTDSLTGEQGLGADEFDRAADEVVSAIGKRALELHHEWRIVAYPGPKGSTSKGDRSKAKSDPA